MNHSVKVILISQVPLPFLKIGSWTTLYKNYLENGHKIDAIVCPLTENIFEKIQYSFVKKNFFHELQRKFLKKKNAEYFKALSKLIVPNENYIIQIIDNYGIVKPLKNYLISKGIEKQFYIQFFYHGYPPHIQKDAASNFYEVIDELVLLTNDSYKAHQNQIAVLPAYFSILYNGIDTQKFSKVSVNDKIKLKDKLGFGNKNVFVWCSQDKPKKGLELILEVWREIFAIHKNIILIVIGCNPHTTVDGVQFLGKIPNDQLPKYYQASDCYLFPTLCQEGFGLSLIEALHCGNYCIASAFGGVPEVLQYGKLGKLIENPHSNSEWIEAINDFLYGKVRSPIISEELYSIENWKNGMNIIIEKAKMRITQTINL